MNAPLNGIYKFGEFTLDGNKRLLLQGNSVPVALTPKVFDLLLYLVQHAGTVAGKDELLSAVWPDTIVEENNLSQNISILRRALGEKRGEHQFIATIPGSGYKFVAEVIRSESATEPREAIGPKTNSDASTRGSRNRPILIGLAAAVLILATATGYFLFSRRAGGESSTTRTLAVLPFKPIVAENRDEALEMGIADTLIAKMGASRDILVRPLASVRRFGELDQDPQAAGRALGVDSVLDGSIQRAGENIRVNVRLIDVANGATLWSGIFDERFTNIFAVQDQIAGKVADALKVRFAADRTGSANPQTRNPEAYRLYLQGRYFSQKITPPEVRRGIEFFQQAIDSDPTYALAYAGMADAYRSLPINGDIPSGEAMPKARAAAEQALRIDPGLSDAHSVLGWVGFWFDQDWAGAENEFRIALELNPNNPDARRGYSVLLTCLGRHDEAIAQMRKAREIDPLSLITNALEGQAFLYAGEYDLAIGSLDKLFEIDPNFWVGHIQLSRICIQQGNFDAAIAEAEKARQFSGGNSESISLAGFAEAKAGRPEKALDAVNALKAMQAKGLITYYNTAMVYNGLGKSDEALDLLNRAVEAHDVRLILLKVDHRWDNLRSDPRFAEIMNRLNFE